ncbi:MAG: hypothetical protein JWO36_1194 [Myxococcales bacterium]|nr:hypothetical protein [Myxococcales bacterium]
MLPSDKQATEVIEVQGEAPHASPGADKLDRTELRRIPEPATIPCARSRRCPVVNFQFPLDYSGVEIRGSSPQDSKILIDDFEVPVLYHDIGFRSIVRSQHLHLVKAIQGERFQIGNNRGWINGWITRRQIYGRLIAVG